MDVEGAVAGTIAKVGLWWPLAEEDQLRRAAGAYERFAGQVRGVATTGAAAAKLVTGDPHHGKAIDAFATHWALYDGSGTSGLPATASAATEVASALKQYADKVVEAKHLIINLALEAVTIMAVGAVLSVFTAFTTAGAAVARVAMLVARGATIAAGMSSVATALVAPLLVIAGGGALSGFLGSLVAQAAEIQLTDGHGISLGKAINTAAASAVLAPVGAVAFRAARGAIRGVRPSKAPYEASPVLPAGRRAARPANLAPPHPSAGPPVRPAGVAPPPPVRISTTGPGGRSLTIHTPESGPPKVVVRAVPKPVTRETIPPPIVRERPLPTMKLLSKFDGEADFTNPRRLFFPDTVHYLTTAERESLRVVPINGRLYKTDGTLLDTFSRPGTAGRRYLYVMDENGNLYVSPLSKTGLYHHSSIVDGEPVAGAGEMVVDNGKIVVLSRSSGHYLPETDDERRVVDVLQRQGLDLSDVRFVGY